MATDREPPNPRADRDRRVRQCERFARLIRLTRLLLGHGRWGPDDLAREIGCSVRTVYRDIAALTMAGVPVHFDKDRASYRVPEGFRFPGLDPVLSGRTFNSEMVDMIDECQRLLDALRKRLRDGGGDH